LLEEESHSVNAVLLPKREIRATESPVPDCIVQCLFASESEATLPREGWKPLMKGVEILPLFTAGVNGASAALVRYAPGAVVPRHLHRGKEHVMILTGSQRDERGTYTAGKLVIREAGSIHEVTSDDGCVAMIHWTMPVMFLPE
jgi:anti-sigma factor ChrR (cupin superfamily)